MAHYYQIDGYDSTTTVPVICRTGETFRDKPRFYYIGDQKWKEDVDLWWHTFMAGNDWDEITEQQAFDVLHRNGATREGFESD